MMHAMHVYPLDSKHIIQINTLKIVKADFMNICECPHTSELLKSIRKTEQEPRAREQQWLQQSQQNTVAPLEQMAQNKQKELSVPSDR